MTRHKPRYKRIAQLKTPGAFREYLEEIGANISFDEHMAGPSALGKPYRHPLGKTIGNRCCVLPMEGWDGTPDGRPSDYTRRRWHRFAISGAKLLWGCEAVAVTHEGRANPNQLLLNGKTYDDLARLFQQLIADHEKQFDTSDDLHVGLQLTHSGRFSKPNDPHKHEPRILYHHPLLDAKFGLEVDSPILSDDQIDRIIDHFVEAAVLAHKAGFHFVDIKHCHGYLGHEFLTARHREGKYGGSFENRTRFLRSVVEGIRASAHGLECGVRLSAFDFVPFRSNEHGVGVPETFEGEYDLAFGSDLTGLTIDHTETFRFLELLRTLKIPMVCITAGSPYYNPHIQRPALFPPSDGYEPPEDPLVGVARQCNATAKIKEAFPDLAVVGSGYSYLQEWLPHVAHYVLSHGMADFVGFGRIILPYPEMPDDILNSRPLKRAQICRTFSDCTTAPRNAMISGCYPLDQYYKELPGADRLKTIKHE